MAIPSGVKAILAKQVWRTTSSSTTKQSHTIVSDAADGSKTTVTDLPKPQVLSKKEGHAAPRRLMRGERASGAAATDAATATPAVAATETKVEIVKEDENADGNDEGAAAAH